MSRQQRIHSNEIPEADADDRRLIKEDSREENTISTYTPPPMKFRGSSPGHEYDDDVTEPDEFSDLIGRPSG